jgi:hypothetical protein
MQYKKPDEGGLQLSNSAIESMAGCDAPIK